MPKPAFEGVARQTKAALIKAGGEALANKVYSAKAVFKPATRSISGAI